MNKRKSLVGSMISDDNLKEVTSNSVKTVKKEEKRTKRINGLLKPSLYKKVTKKCKRLNISFNECVNQLLEEWASDEE